MTRVKICGVTSAEDRAVVVNSGADAMGVVSGVTVDTPREVDEATAADLVAGVPPFVTSVLVTMPSTVEKAVQRAEAVEPNVVQIHTTLDPGEVGALRRRLSARVVAAVEPDPETVAEYAAVADAVLVDSVDAEGGGGTGETHDWERTREVVDAVDAPVILAGGLTPDNVATAVETVDPYAVDVASGVEASGGVKDHDAVERFVERAREATRNVDDDGDDGTDDDETDSNESEVVQ